jgi:hypothetical protein
VIAGVIKREGVGGGVSPKVSPFANWKKVSENQGRTPLSLSPPRPLSLCYDERKKE